MTNVSVKARPYPLLPIDTCPVTQAFSLARRLSIKSLSRPLLAEEEWVQTLYSETGWLLNQSSTFWISTPRAPRSQSFWLAAYCPFKWRTHPAKEGKAAVMNSWLSQGLSLAHRSVTIGSASFQTSIDRKTRVHKQALRPSQLPSAGRFKMSNLEPRLDHGRDSLGAVLASQT